jgi:hypothetical protein
VKVIFLDIDGVLNSTEWCKAGNGFGHPPPKRAKCTRERLRWCPDMVKRLKWIIDCTDAKIVISSSWRGYGPMAVRKWRAMFRTYGWRNAPVIGETPVLGHKTESGILVAKLRGDEVAAWIASHTHVVDNYVCLDDGGDFRPDQPLVQTTMERGLTADDATRCVELLNAEGVHSLLVVLEENFREDDVQGLIEAIAHMRGVAGVKKCVADPASVAANRLAPVPSPSIASPLRMSVRLRLWAAAMRACHQEGIPLGRLDGAATELIEASRELDRQSDELQRIRQTVTLVSDEVRMTRDGWYRFNDNAWHPIQRFALAPNEDEETAVKSCFADQRVEFRAPPQ